MTSEFQKFDNTMRQLIKVPHSEIKVAWTCLIL